MSAPVAVDQSGGSPRQPLAAITPGIAFMRKLIPAVLLALPLLPSCAGLLIGAGVGLIASQELMDNNSYVTHIQKDVSYVWPEVKTYLSDSSLDLIEIDEELRVAKAKIDGAMVTVSVEAYDIDHSVMNVAAKKFGVTDGEMARIVTERINRRLIAGA